MTELTEFKPKNPISVLTDEKEYSKFYEDVKAECDKLIPDVSTTKGRKEIASLAYKVARSKTALDDAGKKLNEQKRAEINAVDETRRKIREELDALRDEVRKPLTEWEKAEEDRIKAVNESFQNWERIEFHNLGRTSAEIEASINTLEAQAVTEEIFAERYPVAVARHKEALGKLSIMHTAALKSETDALEMERLRKLQAEREAEDQARREAEELKRAEDERVASEKRAEEEAARAREEAEKKAEQDRLDAIDRERKEASAAAERKAEEERKKLEIEHQEREAASQAEIQRLKDENDKRAADEAQKQREADARAKDREHRSKLGGECKEDIIKLGVDPDLARQIVLAIMADEVRHVKFIL